MADLSHINLLENSIDCGCDVAIIMQISNGFLTDFGSCPVCPYSPLNRIVHSMM